MELVFKKVLEIDPEELSALEELTDIQKKQLVIVAKSFQGSTIDFEEDYLERHEEEFELVFEFGMKLVQVFDADNASTPRFDAWSDNCDAVYVFHHGQLKAAGATRSQGGFDPVDKNNADDVALAKAFDAAQLKASDKNRL